MGDLFYERVSPLEIESMKYCQLRYWDKWHKLFEKTRAEANKLNKGKK